MDEIMYIDAKRNISNTISVIKKTIDHQFPLHWHDFFEMDIILDGNGYQVLNGKKFPLKKGMAYILRPTDFHAIYAEKPLVLLNIMFHEKILSDEFIAMLLNQSCDIIALLKEDAYSEITGIADILLKEYNRNFVFKEKYIKNLMDLIFIIFMREFETDNVQNFPYDGVIKKALLYMHMHFREKLSLEEVAHQAGFCPSYFSKIFCGYTGTTYTEYVARLRLEYAARILENSNITSTDLCFECGFSSVSNFLKAFKRYYGMSPKEYKRKNVNKSDI